jgi:hypothetical protein
VFKTQPAEVGTIMTLDASLESASSDSLVQPGAPSRHADSWAAYGRFIYASVRTHCSRRVEAMGEGLCYFQRPVRQRDASMLYAYQDCGSRDDSVLTTATRALRTLLRSRRVDHLNVYVAGMLPPEDASGRVTHAALDGAYVAVIFPYETHDILEFPPSFEEFLRSMGHSNRRHMKARQEAALKAGMRFLIGSDPSLVSAEERYLLGMRSRPMLYSRETINSWNDYALSQPRSFQCTLRTPAGELMSYCIGFVERDTAVMMYQLNHEGHPQLGLSMTLRGFLIQHLTGSGVRRMVLPMGVAGHLKHAGTTNPVAQVLFVKRSLPALAKALVLRLSIPTSHAALMVATPGFAARMILGGSADFEPAPGADSVESSSADTLPAGLQ